MVKVGNEATMSEKEVKTAYPNEDGLEAGTQKQEGRQSNLVAEQGSNVPRRYKELL